MSTKLQHFGLRLHQQVGSENLYELMVNHQPYLSVLRDYEAPFAGRIAGAYQPGLSLASLTNNNGTLVPFVCTCSEPTCWFIKVQVEVIKDINADYVIWHCWSNPYRADKTKAAAGLFWDYSDLPPLVFDLEQYQAEIARVTAQQ